MNSICLCMDMEGFFVNGDFVVRELGWSDGETAGCIHYDHAVKYSQLSDKDKKTVDSCGNTCTD